MANLSEELVPILRPKIDDYPTNSLRLSAKGLKGKYMNILVLIFRCPKMDLIK
jgi:hypothetical protein